MRALAAVLMWLSMTTLAAAQDCFAGLAMEAAGDGVLHTVADGIERAHFYRSSEETPGCPYGPDCRRRGFVVGGDAVMVTDTVRGFACAVYVGSGPAFTVTAGWIESGLLVPAVPGDVAADFPGRWGYGEFHELAISPAGDGLVHISGSALFGADDPGRVERGAVNVGALDVVAPAGDDEIAFTVDWDNVVHDHGYGEPEDGFCRVRMHREGPYLVVSDNYRCGGMNVTFSGVYRRAP